MSKLLPKTRNYSTNNINVRQLTKYILVFSFALLFISNANSPVNAQTVIIPDDAVPPPLKVITQEERNKLSAETKIKKRTKLSLELMDIRMVNAENFAGEKQYIEMFKELGRFHALVDNTLDFLDRNNKGRRKILNEYKRFEIGLRPFLPRLELIRRELPAKYEYYVRGLAIKVRDARSKAVAPMFDNSVVSEN